MRIGFASDIHRLVEGRKLLLGGVHIPFEFGELAYSDGDVVYHAVAESILGALSLGDLGEHFPDTSDTFKDYDSSLILQEVVKLMKKEGYVINNIDVSITLEKPKLKEYKNQMRNNIALLLKTDIHNVSIKSGTNEELGEIGQGKAVKAESTVLLKKEEM